MRHFIVSRRRVLLTSGVIARTVTLLPLRRITDLTWKETLLGQVLGLRHVPVRVGRPGPGAAPPHLPAGRPGACTGRSAGCCSAATKAARGHRRRRGQRGARAAPSRRPRRARSGPDATTPSPSRVCPRREFRLPRPPVGCAVSGYGRLTAMRIDLHTHSSVSDGTEDPADAHGDGAGARVSTSSRSPTTTPPTGWAAAEARAPAGLTVVPGMELSCRWFPDERPADQRPPAGLPVRPHAPGAGRRARAAARRAARAAASGSSRRLVDGGYPLKWDADRRGLHAGGVVGRPHIARALVDAGAVDVGRPRVRHPAAPPQPVLRGEGRHRRTGGHRAGPGGRGSAGLRPRAGHQAGAGRWATTPSPRWPRPDCSASRSTTPTTRRPSGHTCAVWPATSDLIVTGSSDFHGTNKRRRSAPAPPTPRSWRRILAAGTGSAPFRD